MYRLLMQLLRCTITCRRLSSLDWRWFIRTGGSQRDCTNCSASLDRYPSAVLPHSSCHRFPLFPVSSPKKLAQVSVDITFCFARFFVSLCLSFRLAPSLSIPLPSPISSSPFQSFSSSRKPASEAPQSPLSGNRIWISIWYLWTTPDSKQRSWISWCPSVAFRVTL